ncbi:MAG: carboxylating nicotinate-nucleotide diphosphorylase [Gammaproteobacteria bacterium]
MNEFPPPAPDIIRADVRQALAEDIGSGDVTANLIEASTAARARVVTREDAIICGRPWFDEVFRQLSADVRVAWHVADGARAAAGDIVCELHGPARTLLSGERTALNFLQLLSGTATLARRYVDTIAGTGATILDTRKTIPGLRQAQKYAVRCGGARNHRLGLYDAVLIKENHIAACGGVAAAIAAARRAAARGMPIEIEVENLEQLHEALAAGATRLLLDNFTLDGLRTSVRETKRRARLEASGGVTLANVRTIAETGVDDISIGDITKNVHAIDLSMRFDTV